MEADLKSRHAARRGTAIDRLTELGPRAVSATPCLFSAHKASSVDAERRKIAAALVAMGPKAVPYLVRSLSHARRPERVAAARLLRHMEPLSDNAVVPLIDALRRCETCAYRKNLLIALGNAGTASAPAVPLLVQRLREGDVEEVAGQLARIGTAAASAVPALIEALVDDDPNRHAISGALVAIGPSALPGVLSLLRGTRDNVRPAAAWVLVQLHRATAVAPEVLGPFSRDRDPRVRRIVAEALDAPAASRSQVAPISP